MQTEIKAKAWVTILISNKIYLKIKAIVRDKGLTIAFITI